MEQAQKPRISARKQPTQARSTDLVEAILQAALRILQAEGAHRFTTVRVAEIAGVSIGSLYQYFPNKAAILFRLQADEWRRNTRALQAILQDTATPAPQRLRRLTHAFIASECEEAAIRTALAEAAPLYRATQEAQDKRAQGAEIFLQFLKELLPSQPDAARSLAASLIQTTLRANGRAFSSTPRTRQDTDAFAGALADMICAYVETLRSR